MEDYAVQRHFFESIGVQSSPRLSLDEPLALCQKIKLWGGGWGVERL